MKTSERHHLKSNAFAETLARARAAWVTHRRAITAAVTVATLAVVALSGFLAWRQHRLSQAAAALADAMSVAEAPIIPAPAPVAPGNPQPPAPPAGTYPTEEARAGAALEKLLGVASRYDSTPAGLDARYRAATLLAQLGRDGESEREFTAVIDRDPRGLYGRVSRLGRADVQVRSGRYDAAISTYRDFVAQPGDLPADGLLMQLARAYQLAGKRAEALQTFTRVIEEHPQSLYSAEARREADALKAPAGQKRG